MANSRRFRELESRIKSITKHLLPKTKITGNYSKREEDKIRGYVLLIHAEIEAYFEERVEKKALKAFKDWQLNRKKSNVLTALMSFRNDDLSYTPFDNHKKTEERIKKALTVFINYVKLKNNGIKENNLLKLLLPIGIEEHELDSTWLATMDSFGKTRGDIAHQTYKTQQPLDPVTQQNTVNLVVTEIKSLDSLINKLK